MRRCEIYRIPCPHWFGGCYGCAWCPGEQDPKFSLSGSRPPAHPPGLTTGGPVGWSQDRGPQGRL